MKKSLALLLALCLVVAATACSNSSSSSAPASQASEAAPASSTEAQGSYTPQKNITIFAPYSAGGGVDIWGRNFSAMLVSTGIVDNNWVYENVNGGTGQVGLGTVVSQYQGKDSVLIPTATNYLMTPYIQGKEYSYKDLTMVAQLVVDYRVFVTSAQSGYTSMEDLITASKDHELVAAISGVGGIGHIAIEQFKSLSGASIRSVPFDGNEDTIALLGNQVELGNLALSEALPHIQSGDLIALAVTSEERLPAIPDIPTCTELGYDITFKTGRGVAMPGGVSDEARDYWIDKLQQLVETDEFKAYADNSSNTIAFLAGEDYVADLDRDYEAMKVIMTDLGLAG
ncbi:MAG: hypothetical protein DBX44_05355 [Oscillospiraceae bacterium]|nr:MAG: hypothetical protein DBX44_05355 [Oscillospiraceae bacterium]